MQVHPGQFPTELTGKLGAGFIYANIQDQDQEYFGTHVCVCARTHTHTQARTHKHARVQTNGEANIII